MNTPYKTFIVFDCETGGLSHEKNPMLEIAMVALNNKLEELEEYQSLIIPYGDLKIEQGALQANGLTVEQCTNQGKPVEQVVKDSVDFIKKYGSKAGIILVGHNINKFDIPFLDDLFSRGKKKLGDYVNTDVTVDTLEWCRMKWIESVDYKLGTCCSNLDISLIDGHRAMRDTKATAKLFISLMKSLRGESSSGDKKDNSIIKEPRFRENFEI